MKLLVFSDIHGDAAALERLMAIEADTYIAAGDLVSWGRGLDTLGEIMKRRGSRVWILPGNHESAELTTTFARRFGFHDFHQQSFEANGYHVAGLGYSNPTPFKTPGEYSEKELGERLAKFAALRPLILVCHCPPFGTPLDRVRQGVHAGSRAVREFVDKHQPEFLFCGHIHEAEGVRATLGRTRSANVGRQGYLLDFAKIDTE